jgi:proteasome lid subunit RPN8/RPN11
MFAAMRARPADLRPATLYCLLLTLLPWPASPRDQTNTIAAVQPYSAPTYQTGDRLVTMVRDATAAAGNTGTTPPAAQDLASALSRRLDELHRSALREAATFPPREFLVAMRSDGTVLWQVSGTATRATISGEFDRLLYSPGQRIVLVHNHPTGSGPSEADLDHLTKTGVAAIVVVGHDGSVYMATAGPQFDPVRFLGSLYGVARSAVSTELRARRLAARVPDSVIDMHLAHLVLLALHNAGIVRYHAILSASRQSSFTECFKVCSPAVLAATRKLKMALR